MNHWTQVVGEALLALAAIAVVLLCFTLAAHANVSRSVYPECLNRSLDEMRAWATDWEWKAIRANTRDGDRTLVDLVATDCGAHGFAHFSPGRVWRLEGDSLECPVRDEAWRVKIEAWLYSDWSARDQFHAWRRIIRPAIREARAAGVNDDGLVQVANIAVSRPATALRAERECDWGRECMREVYVNAGTEHLSEERAERRRERRERRMDYVDFVTGRGERPG